MKIIHTTKPTAVQKKDMETLVQSCKHHEPMSLSAPLEEDIAYDIFLLYEKEALSAMAFLFFPEDQRCECCAFVDPPKRRRGFFRALLDPILDLVDAYESKLGASVDFCFLADEQTPSAKAALAALGAEYWYSEHTMERPLTAKDREYRPEPLVIERVQDCLYAAKLDGKAIGSCAVIPSGPRIYLYSFQIQEAYRGQGCATRFLLGMCSLLSHMGDSLSIQVSGQNYIARNLYKKTGFQTTESLSYYLY